MSSQLKVIQDNQLNLISGGHIGGWLGAFVGLIHVREFYNYVADRAIHGCSNIEEGDHFTKLICWK